MTLAIVLVLLVLGSILFHFLSPWWFTPVASNWGSIDDTINLTFWVTGIVFVLVNVFMAYAIYRFRYNKTRKARYEPENKKLEIWLTVITSIGIVAMLAPGLMVWAKFVEVPENASVVEVVGQQWQWRYRFPGQDGELGRTDASFFGTDNPFGIDPTDSNGQDDILVSSNDLHLPLGQPVKVLLRSKDVLHNFTVPQFRVKMDLVPGIVSYIWFTPTRTGRFDVLCEELCGIAHFAMRSHVVVDEERDYQTWLASFPTFAQTQIPKTSDIQAGEALYAVCASCHGQQGEGKFDMNAPTIAGLSAGYIKRQLSYYQQGIRGAHSEDIYGQQMAAMTGVLADQAAIDNVSAYIATLQGKPSDQGSDQNDTATTNGNLAKGRRYFQNCSVCHGENGEGRSFADAPKLAGQYGWYLKRQLINFKQGVRGAHQQDQYGQQMRLLAKVLKDEQAIDDLVAYVGTL